jgi:hypothetical protein
MDIVGDFDLKCNSFFSLPEEFIFFVCIVAVLLSTAKTLKDKPINIKILKTTLKIFFIKPLHYSK